MAEAVEQQAPPSEAQPPTGPLVLTAAGFICATTPATEATGTPSSTCRSEGAVTLDTHDVHVEAASGTLLHDPTRDILTLSDGWVQRGAEPRVEFESATVQSDPSHRWRIDGADVAMPAGRGKLTAARASLIEGATAAFASGVVLEPCTCDDGKPTAITLSARDVEVHADFVLVQGGAIRVFTLPLLPLPKLRVPLDPDRFRLLLPEVGYGTPGLSANLRGQFGLDGWKVTAGPAWRQDRGFRAEALAEGPAPDVDQVGGTGAVVAGWDAVTGGVRGAVNSTAGVVVDGADRDMRAAWDVAWQTDAAYAQDYGLDWVTRGLPRQEQRAVIGLGPARLAVHGVSDSARPLEMVETRLRKEIGDNHAAIAGRTAFAGWGADWQHLAPLAEIGLDARGSWTYGALHAEGAADVAGRVTADWQRVIGAGSGKLEVPMWTGALQLWPGLVATGRVQTGEREAVTRGFVGAGTRADAVVGDWLLTASGHAGVDEAGLTGRARVDLDGPLHLAVHAGRRQQVGEVGLNLPALAVRVGGVHQTERGAWTAWASTDLHVYRMRLGAALSTPLEASPSDADAEWTARLSGGYDDGCTQLLVTAALVPDRDLPDLGLKFVVKR